MKILITFVALIISIKVFATANIEDSIKKLSWNGVDVVFLEDNRFPTYDILIYFADGALSDSSKELGITTHAFNLLDSGTAKLSQKIFWISLSFMAQNLWQMLPMNTQRCRCLVYPRIYQLHFLKHVHY